MSTFLRRRDLDFLLYELLDIEALCAQDRFREHDREIFDQILTTAHQIAAEHFEPCAAKLDANEPTFDGERVHLIPEVGQALRAFIDAGFMAGCFDEADGGLQLPYTIGQATAAVFHAANVSASAYTLLTLGAANLLSSFASDDQKARFMAPMLEGRFFGTMCLSEPGAGSSLTDLRTRAEPLDDGRYKMVGDKMWISGGEHDLSENIVHLVLAKLPDAPPGVKGISLFIVPRDNPDGSSNNVRLVGLNHKMGYRGTVNTVLSFGDDGDCIGELVGEPHKGLRYMFHMMNEARIGVGLGAAMLGYTGFLHSLAYAKDRPQGRHPDQKDPTVAPVPIIEHADVKRMLLAQKAYAEGGMALCLTCARLVDEQHTTEDPDTRRDLGLLLDLLTPIAKAWPSDWCLEANNLAIQVLGGYGYTRDYPVERIYRDNRLNPIHEGTNGIQALDLLGRKVPMKGGAALALLKTRIETTIADARAHPALVEYADALTDTLATVEATTFALLGAAMQGKIRLYLANATAYLNMMGHTVVAEVWLRQAIVASAALSDAHADTDAAFYGGKLRACQYFFRYEVPKIGPWSDLLKSLDDTCLSMPIEQF